MSDFASCSMAKKCVSFLRGQDELGSSVYLHYKGMSGYGTALGGCMSLIVNTFAMIFILGQFYGFLFRPSYNQTIATSYISKNDAEVYTVPLKTFLPVFAILSN